MNLLQMLKTPADRVPRPARPRAPIVDLPDPPEAIIALEYPEKVLFRPLVQVGDEVARNQVIGRSTLGNCLHSPLSGRVREIRPLWSATSHHVPAVVIERSDAAPLTPAQSLAQSGVELASATRVELMKAGGVTSPWTTPGINDSETDLKLYPDIKHLVLVGVNQEPTVFNYELLLQENVEDVRTALRRLQEIAPHAEATLLVGGDRAAWAKQALGDVIRIVGLPAAYRQRIRRVVIPRLTGVDVLAAEAFRSRGIAVVTVEQALAALAALSGHPFIRKTVTLAGTGLDAPVTVRAAVGTSARYLLESQGLEVPLGGRVIMGGPLRGMAQFSADTPLSKFENGVYLLDSEHLPSEVNLTCINCGQCARACPVGLQVHLLGRLVEFGQLVETPRFHPHACLDCGLCAFVCPAHRPLVQMVKMAKKYGG